MPDLSLPLPSLEAMKASRPSIEARTAGVATRQQAEEVARDFERMFIAEMLQPMFAGLETDGPFGGGSAEEAFRPMLIDHYAQSVAAGGGIGVADAVLKEILKLQGLE
jgi:flagellar protein FlgJ